MAGRYPDYDWRGIAMLTQQLGQLFEPSKARLMSQQQDHEMNMLMAKQSWKMQSDNLDALQVEHKALVTKLDSETEAVNILGGRDLVRAGMSDGSLPEETAEVFDKTSLKNLGDLQEADITYRKAIRELETQLGNMKLYNEEAKMGANFSKRMTSLPGAKDQKEYDVLAESDGIPGLSYKEKQKALNMYLKDTGRVLNEGDEGYNDGMDQQVWNGTEYEDLKVKPEGVAYIAGYNATLDKEAISGKKIAASAEDKGRPNFPSMEDQYVIELFNQNNERIQQIDNKFSGKPDKKTLASHLAFNQFGDYYAKETAKGEGYTDGEIVDYVVSMNYRKKALGEIRTRPQLDIPADKLNVKHPMSYTINKTDNPSTAKMFGDAKISPDILYAKILMKEGDDKHVDMVTAYDDIMKGDAAFTEDVRLAGLNAILRWVNE